MMNERIKELAKQSGMDIYGLGLDRNKWEDTVERFAKLIIQECCEVAREWEDDYVVEDTAPSHVDIKIEKHFGVE